MRLSVFIETTIPSYYVARRARDIVQAARQELTIEWWDEHRTEFDLFCSVAVLAELRKGEAAMAEKRERLLEGIPLLDINEHVISVAEDFLVAGIIPRKAADDAFHIACAAVHRMDFLLTWNCKHIANPQISKWIRARLAGHGLDMPVICTPEEFLGDYDTDTDTPD